MNGARINPRWCAGASLLEVLVAVSLLAVSLLGIAAAQLAALREADSLTSRVRASWVATSIAEAMRSPESASFVLTRARMDAEARLPGARVSIVDEAADVSAVVVRWTPGSSTLEQRLPTYGGACADIGGHALANCLTLPFANAQ